MEERGVYPSYTRERLDDFDLAFLYEMFDNAREIQPMIDQHPEYQDPYARAVDLYHELIERALENEKKAGEPDL